MIAYTNNFVYISQLSLPEALQFSFWEPLFVIKQWIISRFTTDTTTYIVISLILYISLLSTVVNKLFTPWQRIFVIYLYFNFVFFYAYIFNGMRQGFSMMFMLLLIALIANNASKFKRFFTIICAALFHYSSIPIVLFIVIANKLKLKTLLALWVILAFLFITNLNQIFSYLPISFVERYTSQETLEHYGGAINNIKFLIFNTAFLLIGIYLNKKIDFIEGAKEMYLVILKSYIASNIIFMMFGFIAFSNRIASFSWLIIPILIIYPILNQKNHHQSSYSSVFLFSALSDLQ